MRLENYQGSAGKNQWRLQRPSHSRSLQSHPAKAGAANAQVPGPVSGARRPTPARPLWPQRDRQEGRASCSLPGGAAKSASSAAGPRAGLQVAARRQEKTHPPARLGYPDHGPTPTPRHLLGAGATDPPCAVIDVAADHRATHVQPQHEACGRARRARLREPLLRGGGQNRHPERQPPPQRTPSKHQHLRDLARPEGHRPARPLRAPGGGRPCRWPRPDAVTSGGAVNFSGCVLGGAARGDVESVQVRRDEVEPGVLAPIAGFSKSQPLLALTRALILRTSPLGSFRQFLLTLVTFYESQLRQSDLKEI